MTTQRARGDKLAKLRRDLGFTQCELAIRSGVSERTVRNAESGRSIKRDFLEYIASGLKVPLEDVLCESDVDRPEWFGLANQLIANFRDAFASRYAPRAWDRLRSLPQTQQSTAEFDEAWKLFDPLLVGNGRQHDVRTFGAINDPNRRFQLSLKTPFGGHDEFVIRGAVTASPHQAFNLLFHWMLVCAHDRTKVTDMVAFASCRSACGCPFNR